MSLRTGFRLREWLVEPDQNRISGADGEIHLASRSMDVLVCLAERAGEVVTREDFSEKVWSPAVVTDDALTQCISEIRRALGDSARNPRYIQTIPKRGYRLVAPVTPLERKEIPAENTVAGVKTSLLYPFAFLAILTVTGTYFFLDARHAEAPDDRSIAVLPFEVVGTDERDHFAEGMHHDLLTRLSGIDDLRVISSTSVKQYQDTARPIGEIAEELGVAWVVEGAVQQAGNKIQVNAQLVDARTDTHLWARTYERTLTAENLFAIQAEVTEDITRSLQAHLSPGERARATQVPTENLDAYRLYVRARTLLRQRSESSMRRALDLFGQAAEEDPEYADAWAGLADARNLLAYYGHEKPADVLPQARNDARTALELDPNLAYAHATLGVIHMQLDHDGPAALKALNQAYELSEESVGWLAWLQAVLGDLGNGIVLMENQVSQRPFSPPTHWSLATLYLADGRLEQALSHTRKARQLSPGYASASVTEGQALMVMGRYREAIAAMERGLELAGPEARPAFMGWLAAALGRAGETSRARELLVHIEDTGDPFALGLARLGLGETGGAIEALAEVEWNDLHTLHLRYHPFLEPLRQDSRFAELIRDLNRWWGLEPDGRLPEH
jgi:TolB-like protein/DNA-binding winged helix-turn-helix (wHTH) protein/Tfp pilus assembly protein PilF